MNLRPIALATLIGASLAPAWATSTSTATLSSITIKLVDLNATDGITPFLTFSGVLDRYGVDDGHLLSVGATEGVGLPGRVDAQDLQRTPRLNQPGTVSVSTGTSSAAASLAGDGSQVTLSGAGTYATALTGLSASGSATGLAGGGSPAASGVGASDYRANAQIFPFDPVSGNFLLSANTLLLVTVSSSLTVSTTLADDALTGQHEWATAQTWVELVGKGPAGSSFQRSAYDDVYRATTTPGTYSHTQTMIVSFVNATDSAMGGKLNLQTYVTGSSILAAAPVPEPASLALLLAGLAVVGTASHRQRRRSA